MNTSLPPGRATAPMKIILTCIVCLAAFISQAQTQILTDAGFEGPYTSGVANGWTTDTSGASMSCSSDTSGVEQGTNSQKIVVSGSPPTANLDQTFSFKNGHVYKASVWLRASAANSGVGFFFSLNKRGVKQPAVVVKNIGTAWTNIVINGGFQQDGTAYFTMAFSNNVTYWADNASLTDVTTNYMTNTVQTPGAAISTNMMGILINGLSTGNWPPINQTVIRLWDTGTRWEQVQPTSGSSFTWTHLDNWVNNARTNSPGIRIMYTMGMTPAWANAGDDTKPPTSMTDWSNYVYQVASRYNGGTHGTIRDYEVWNEWDANNFYTGTVADMVTMATLAKEVVTNINSQNIVHAPVVTLGGFEKIAEFVATGGKAVSDIYGFHNYPNALPEHSLGPVVGFEDMLTNSGININNNPVWVTEGAPDSGEPLPVSNQNNYTNQAIASRAYLVFCMFGIQSYDWYTWDKYTLDSNGNDTNQCRLGGSGHVASGGGWGYSMLATNVFNNAEMLWKTVDANGNWEFEVQKPGQGANYIVWNPNGPNSFTIPLSWNIYQARNMSNKMVSISGGSTTVGINPIIFDSLSSGSSVPPPWVDTDVGPVGIAGNANFSGISGIWSITGSGANVFSNGDECNFVYQPWSSGDVQLTVDVLSISNTSSFAKAGLMIRQDTSSNSIMATCDLEPSPTGVEAIQRLASGGNSTNLVATGVSAPRYLQLTRSGNTITAATSTDGVTYTPFDTNTVTMSGTVDVGMFVCSHDNTKTNLSTFTNIVVGATALPSTPAGVTASAGVNQVSVTWNQSGSASGYNVLRSTSPGAEAFYDTTSATNYVDSGQGNGMPGLSADATYYYEIVATNSVGNSGNSSAVSATPVSSLPSSYLDTDIGQVGTPGLALYDSGSGTFTIAGSGSGVASNNDEFHYVYTPVTGDVDIVVQVADMNSFMDQAEAGIMIRQALTTNSPMVTADVEFNAGIESLWRTNTGGMATNAFLPVSFENNDWPEYWVQLLRQGNTFTAFASSNDVDWIPIATNTFVMSNNAYIGLFVSSYTNSTEDFDSFIDYSVDLLPTCSITNPLNGAVYSAPANITIQAAAADADGTVTNLAFLTNGVAAGQVTGPPYQLTLSSLPAGTYNLTVVATDDDGLSTTSAGVNVTVSAVPAQPTITSAAAGPNQVALTWNSSAGALGYLLKRSTTSGGEDTGTIIPVSSTSDTDSGLAANTQYFYVVSATNAAGSSSDSLETNATTAPVTPTGLTPTGGANQVALSWTVSAGASSYNVWTNSGGTWYVLASVTTAGYTNTGLAAGTSYSYEVSALNASGAQSTNSSSVSAITLPAQPTGLSATPSATQVALTWTGVTGASSYNVLRSTTSGTESFLASAGSASYTDTAVVQGLTYYYEVNAADASGQSPNSTEASAVVPLPAPYVDVDIGQVVPGLAAYTNSTGFWTVEGSGANVYTNADAFNFVYQSWTGAVQVIAHVDSVQASSSFAKGGIMIRQNLTTNSTMATVDVEHSAGVENIWRTTTAANATNVVNTPPNGAYWVKLVYNGSNSIGTAFSPDAVNWTNLNTETVVMTNPVYLGLFANSHSASLLCTDVFDSLSVDIPPTCSLTNPVNGTVYPSPATITFMATASDADGTVTNVAFQTNGVTAGQVTGLPYQFTLNNVAAGSYNLDVVAWDNAGAVSTSAVVSVTVSPLPNLAAWFPLEEGAANINTNLTHDAINGYTGYFSNGVAASPKWLTNNLAANVLGGTVAAVQFNASASSSTDPYIITTYPGVLSTNARTIAAWIYASNSQPNNAAFISYGDGGVNGHRMTLRLDTTNTFGLRVEVQNAAAFGSTALTNNAWHHVAMTFPSGGTVSNILLYVDGVAETVSYVNGATNVNTTNVNAQEYVMLGNSGVSTNTYGFNGSIDDVRFYTNVLTATQISELVFGRNPHVLHGVLPPTLSFSQQGGNLMMSWSGNWVLQMSPVLDGGPSTWVDVPDAANPYTVPVQSQGTEFFRLRSP